MRPLPPLFLLLLFATLVVDVAALTLAAHQPWHSPAVVLFFALALSQVSLLALWLVLGTGDWLLRFVALAAGIAAWGQGVWQQDFANWTSTFLTLFCLQALVVLLPAAGLRMIGFCWYDARNRRPHELASPARIQFSLRHLFIWTTAVATLLVLSRFATFPPPERLIDLIAMVLTNTIIAVLTTGVVAGETGLVWRVSVVATVILIIGASIAIFVSDVYITLAFLNFSILSALFFTCWLSTCRVAGYRIARIPARKPAPTDAAPPPSLPNDPHEPLPATIPLRNPSASSELPGPEES